MLNYIWLGLILVAVAVGGINGSLKAVTEKGLAMAEYSVMQIALPLVGIMALWLGIMRLAERAGLVAILARAMRPLLRFLFPDVPADHPAMGSMLMNMAANMLGLGNAATPLGLRAMKDLESLNPRPGTATNAMCMFLAINTGSIQLIPVTAIAILSAAKSTNPSAIVGTSIMATFCAAVSAITVAKLLSRLPIFRVRDESPVARGAIAPKPATEASEKAPLKEASSLQPIRLWGHAILFIYAAFFVFLFLRQAFPTAIGFSMPTEQASQTIFVRVVNAISILSIPLILSLFPLYAALRRVKVYEEFVDGAKEGFDVGIRIIPYLIAMLVAIGMIRAAGVIDMLSHGLKPVMMLIGFPSDLLPLVLMRPLSGSGSLGVFSELVQHFGPDSLIARTAGTIYGSTETTFYVLAVYFGAVGVKRTRYALLAGLCADAAGIIASIIICRIVFG